ncbi:DUF1062 domain-containing protein [Streptomyces sp. NPDC001020]
MPTRLPLIRRRCYGCASERFRTSGKFRVNAHHKLLDAWLLALCTGCGATAKFPVLERMGVRSIRRDLLDRLHGNDPQLAAELLLKHQSRIPLNWDGAWRLDTGTPDRGDVLDVAVHFEAPIPVRPVRLIAAGLGLPRAEAERLVVDGKLVSVIRLTGKTAADFGFTLKR